jgi:hypothetical protein
LSNDKTQNKAVTKTDRGQLQKEVLVPIRPFLAGRAFEPEAITTMSAALESVCKTLGLNIVDDAATRLVAQKIIELAQRGMRDVTTLSEAVLEELKRS